MALLPDVVSIIVTQILMNVHRHPPYSRFHPVYALVQSLVLFCLYVPVIFINWLIAYSEERSMDRLSDWRALCYGEMGLQAVLAICWAGLVVCSCVAVHKWRHVAREERVERAVRGALELKGLEGRNDSANMHGDREGLVGVGMERERVFV